MNTFKLILLFFSIFPLQILQSAQGVFNKEEDVSRPWTHEEVARLWGNAHNDRIAYFNNMHNFEKMAYLRYAVLDDKEQLVKELLEDGTDITLGDYQNATPWFYAVAKNNKNIMKMFLDHGVSLDIKDSHGLTPLHFAVKKNDRDTVNLLQRYLPLDAKNWVDDQGRSPLFYAQTPEMFKLLKDLDLLADINMQDVDGKTALHYAIIADATTMIEILVRQGADINLPDKKKRTPLVYALNKNDYQIIKIFLDNSADIQVPDKDGYTILHFAVQTNNHDLLKLLLDYNIDFYAQDNKGKTAYHFAVESGNVDILKELLEGGYYYFEDKRLVDNYGRTPVYYVKNINILVYLKNIGALSNINNMRDNEGLTPLHYAVRQCASYEIIQFFINDLGADIMIKDFHGLTAYEYALDEYLKNMLEVKTWELLDEDELWEIL